MHDLKTTAASLIHEFKGDSFAFGRGCFPRLGTFVAELGSRVAVVTSGVGKSWGPPLHEAIRASLTQAGVEIAGELIAGPAPNAPVEDVRRIAAELGDREWDAVVVVGGGSNIDGTKAACAMWALRDSKIDVSAFYGVNRITELLEKHGGEFPPLVAAQTAAASASHLTRISCVTEMDKLQKMLIVDPVLTPRRALFDYDFTLSMSSDFTADGGLDGMSHCFEVLLSLPPEKMERSAPYCLTGIELIARSIETVMTDPKNPDAREAIALGTDLGGCALMMGGTSGAHLNSFSVVDLLSHGRACAVMNPYYAVFFAPAVEEKLRAVGAIFERAGYSDADFDSLEGKELGIAVAQAWHRLSRKIGFPITLGEIDGFCESHVGRILEAAKNPALEAKLKNMPTPMTADQVDRYMGSVVAAAVDGDFAKIECL